MLENIYNQKVTILNKLKASDSSTKVDTWHKTVIDNAAWYKKMERTVSGSGVVIGSYITCLIPHSPKYLDYTKWKSLEDMSEKYTMSSGDYLVLGEVSEEITASNIISVIKSYGDDACVVKHFEELHDRFNSHVQLHVEGV